MRAFSDIPTEMFSFWKKKSPGSGPADSGAAPASVEAAADGMPDAPLDAQAPDGIAPGHAPAQDEAAPGRAGWRERLRNSGFARGLGSLFVRNPPLDDELLDAIETCLLTADVGVAASSMLVEDLRRRMHRREFSDAGHLLRALRAQLVALVEPVAQPLNVDAGPRPFVILTVGVNGVGKTTTIGKLAKRYVEERKQVLLAAGDTFRAAAVEQLRTWGERNGVAVIAQGSGADSASVIFDALQAAQSRHAHLLIADTAGRLHTQSGLMDELSKIKRVLGKLDPTAPHEVLLVIDGTTGQNAINQLRQFHAAVGVTGLVVTKLDGTAKGGVVFALAREFGIPIRFVGLGESLHDLRAFDAHAFVDALLPESLSAN
jgi:fused signal recognition particle receptor